MNTLNKNLLMGGVAACAVAFASCGDNKTDSADVTSEVDEVAATVKDTAKDVANKAEAVVAEVTAKTETVSINLSGLK